MYVCTYILILTCEKHYQTYFNNNKNKEIRSLNFLLLKDCIKMYNLASDFLKTNLIVIYIFVHQKS